MTAEAVTKKRSRDAEDSKAAVKLPNVATAEEDLDLDLSSDIKGILAALQQVKHKAKSDGQKKNEEIISSVTTEVKLLVEDAKQKAEKERQALVKSATKICKECESTLKDEATKYQAMYDNFSKQRASHQQVYEDAFAKFEDAKEKLRLRYDQQRKKEKNMISDLQKMCSDKIEAAEASIKKKKKEESSLGMLRKTLGSFLDFNEDEDPE